jgi:hypothetical protein
MFMRGSARCNISGPKSLGREFKMKHAKFAGNEAEASAEMGNDQTKAVAADLVGFIPINGCCGGPAAISADHVKIVG